MNTTADFLDFLDAWATGRARAVTQMDYEMLHEMTDCADRLDDARNEDLGLPPDSTVGDAASAVLELLEEWSSELQAEEELVRHREEYGPTARKLCHLLAAGEHEYLKALIDELHATLPPEPEPFFGSLLRAI
jgi:hypothetical protein